MYAHIPVLLDEVLAQLALKPGDLAVDATLGGGGYTEGMLKAVGPTGKVLSIDLDQEAIEHTRNRFGAEVNSGQLTLAHGNFRDIDQATERHGFNVVSGICADIGLSSYQLEAPGRGMSFQKRELLDMRFDATGDAPDARFLLRQSSEQELASIFSRYGEEPFSSRIAREIVRVRMDEPIRYTDDLAALIKSALPGSAKRFGDSAVRRVFQAIRIAVNHELDNLADFLPKAFDILKPGGVLAVVTFHSLEDRAVKTFFRTLATGCVCPSDFPECRCGQTPKAELLTKKSITATETELEANSRSKPARLRAVRKVIY